MAGGRSSGKRKFTFRSVVGRTVLFGGAALMLVCYASMYVNPAVFWPAALFTIAAYPIALFNLILFFLAVFGRSRAFWVPLLVLVPAAFMLNKQVSFAGFRNDEVNVPADDVTMVSYNVGQFYLAQTEKKINSEEIRSRLLRSISEYDADIICLQEFRVASRDEIEELARLFFPGYQFRYYVQKNSMNSLSGNITLSRFPISDSGVERFDGSANLAIYADLDVEGSPVRVYNCHFQSYSISTSGLVKSFVEDREFALNTGKKLRNSIVKRPKQVGQVLDNVASSPNEAIICGDFNDTPMSYTYNSLLKGRKDTFVEAGSGFGATYSVLWPLLRIDYVFVPESFSVLSHETPKLVFSDHYPVVARFIEEK